MSAELVSIVLPIFNGQKYVRAAIDSILCQSHENFELIIVDDGSTDDSLTIVSSYADPRIKIFKNKKNLGIVDSLNRGISLSNGEYIARMDSDDIAFPNRLKKQLEFIKKNDCDLTSARAVTFGESKEKIFPTQLNPSEIEFGLLFVNLIVHPLVFARATVLKSNLYSSEYEGAEDYELWTRLVLSGCKLAVQDDVLLHYRVHKLQISQAKKSKQVELANCIRNRYFLMMSKKSEVDDDDFFCIGLSRYSEMCREDRFKSISSNFKLKMLIEAGIKNVNKYAHLKKIKSIAKEFDVSIPFRFWIIAYVFFIDAVFLSGKVKENLGLK
jgi:glycosyltransferase involved in cell wall biosynthesis